MRMEKVEKNENCVNNEKKKKKKKKKKSKLAVEQEVSSTSAPLPEEKDGYCSVSDMLPRKVGEKAVFKDLEVTLTEGVHSSGILIPVTEKKKKEPEATDYSAAIASFKKDTNKNQIDEQLHLPNIGNHDSKFGQNPNVSITLHNESQMNETSTTYKNTTTDENSTDKNLTEKKPATDKNPTNMQSSSGAMNEGTTTKKKKKKKKKKTPKVKNLEPPETAVEVSEDPVNNPPTYVKLPGSGDNCVLLVSHESFGGNGSAANQQVASDTSKSGEQLDKPRNVKILAKPSSLSIVPTLSMTRNYDASNNQQKLCESEIFLKCVKRSSQVPSNSVSYPEMPSVPAEGTLSPVDDDSAVACIVKTEKICEEVGTEDFNKPVASDLQFHAVDKKSAMVEVSDVGSSLAQESNFAETTASQNLDPQIINRVETEGPTKAQLRAERRALQEKQRAAKLAIKNEKLNKNNAVIDKEKPSTAAQKLPVSTNTAVVKQSLKVEFLKPGHEKEKSRKIRLFSHLPQAKSLDFLLSKYQVDGVTIHPAIMTIGAQYAQGIICGSNARCIALLSAFNEVIKDYVTPPKKDLCRDLQANLQAYMKFLSSCRPLSVSMVNAVEFLKYYINNVASGKSDKEVKEGLLKQVEKFVEEEIFLAKKAICSFAAEKIVDGDVILTYACSSLVKEVLCSAFKEKKFRVVVVDSRPKLEGREMLRNLLRMGIPCSYMLINSIPYVMKEVSKVIIGAHAVQANGYVMSRIGCSQIALVASAYNVPVLVCCETYKFCERAYTDSFVYNELADPHSLVKTNHSQHNHLENWTDITALQVLNLMYDATSPDLVVMVITEKGMLPCTSVPVVLRLRHAGSHEQ